MLRLKIVQYELCEDCKEAPESVYHVLWECQKAKEARECSKLVFSVSDEAILSFLDVMWKPLMHEDVGEEHVAQVVITAWALTVMRYGAVEQESQGGRSSVGRQIILGSIGRRYCMTAQ